MKLTDDEEKTDLICSQRMRTNEEGHREALLPLHAQTAGRAPQHSTNAQTNRKPGLCRKESAYTKRVWCS